MKWPHFERNSYLIIFLVIVAVLIGAAFAILAQ